MATSTDKVDTPIGHTETWPELAVGLWDKLTGRGAVIEYTFKDMDVSVPSGAGKSASHANWKLNGTLIIRTRDEQHGGALENGKN